MPVCRHTTPQKHYTDKSQISDLLSSITGEASPASPSSSTFPPKRKAPNELPKPVDKLQRTNSHGVISNANRPISQPSKPTAPSSTMAAMKIGAKPPNRDQSAVIKNGQPTPPPTTDGSAAKAPKKGSFAEIMARAKAAQQTLGQVGKIQHKKIEKAPSRKEREELQSKKVANIQKNLGPNGKFKSAMPTSSTSKVSEKATFRGKPVPIPEKKVKKAAAATTGYTGTARPRPDGAKPSSKPSSFSRGPDRYRQQRLEDRYLSEDEEEDDLEEEEEGDGYGSDASSDMEAAGWEVDDEEEQASRIARKEDAEALAEENRLKREKLEKKQRLMALAKKRR